MNMMFKLKLLLYCENLIDKNYFIYPSFFEFVCSNHFFLNGNLCDKYFEYRCYKLFVMSKKLKINISKCEIEKYLKK